MNKGIAIAGNLLVDSVKIIDTYPEVGMLTNIRDISKCCGGCVPNTIIDIAKLNDKSVPLKAIGRVGDDDYGTYLTDLLKSFGVNSDRVIRTPGVPTSFTDVMSTISGTRTFFHARGANAFFDISDIDFDTLDVDMLHMGYALLLDKFDEPDPEYGTVLARALATAQSKGIRTSMDVVSEAGDRFSRIVTPSLKYCNYAILNEVESAEIAGIPARDANKKIITENLKKICSIFFEKGVKDIVAIHAPEGCWCMDRAGKFYAVGSVDVPRPEIKGTVGAGDAFCAGMLYSIYKGFDVEKALHVAGCTAACNLLSKNAIDGALPFDEAMKLEGKYGLQAL